MKRTVPDYLFFSLAKVELLVLILSEKASFDNFYLT